MRLLHIEAVPCGDCPLKVALVEVVGNADQRPRYAILSHRWRSEEIMFCDINGDHSALQKKMGYQKLEACCRIALENGLQYLWCDTYCIDKSSSAELSEDINSMYEYYASAEMCIAYLDDIEDPALDGLDHDDNILEGATWFSRGWTLQELIAPRDIHIYSCGWKKLGTKVSLSRQISLASEMAETVLVDVIALERACVSEKMSWAARRITTRPEDRSYSLMGLFGVNMPLLYGEGAERAFRRLQLAILQTTSDHTLFVWDSDAITGDMLAPSVSDFINGGDFEMTNYAELKLLEGGPPSEIVQPLEFIRDRGHILGAQPAALFQPHFTMTNSGLHIQLPMVYMPTIRRSANDVDAELFQDIRLAVLACKLKGENGLIAVSLKKNHRSIYLNHSRTKFGGQTIHSLEGVVYQHLRMPVTDFNPVWISKVPVSQSFDGQEGIPESIQRLRIEMFFKEPTSNTRTHCYHRRMDEKQMQYMDAMVRFRELQGKFPKTFANLGGTFKHYIRGTLSASGINHVAIAFEGHAEIDLVVGVVDRHIWVRYSQSKANIPRPYGLLSKIEPWDEWRTNQPWIDWLHSSFLFPTGLNWRRKSPKIELAPGTRGPLPFVKGHRREHAPEWYAEYVLEQEETDELTLRLYLAAYPPPRGGWSLPWQK